MPLLDIFKKKKLEKEKKKEIKEIKKPKEKKPTEKETVEVPSEIISPKVKEKRIGEAYRILKTPHVTEKSTDLVRRNQYVFRVWPKVNKVEIKKAIENLYEVDVISVKIIKVPRKQRRLGRIQGFRKGYKKAIIKIKEGQKIELLPR